MKAADDRPSFLGFFKSRRWWLFAALFAVFFTAATYVFICRPALAIDDARSAGASWARADLRPRCYAALVAVPVAVFVIAALVEILSAPQKYRKR